MVPSACVWLDRNSRGHRYSEHILEAADRSYDPFQRVINGWLIRRLSPDSNPIKIFDWPKQRDEAILFTSMGRELANVHIGSKRRVQSVLHHLGQLPSGWPRSAAKKMAKAVEADWNHYR
jgi:hypothetical protein